MQKGGLEGRRGSDELVEVSILAGRLNIGGFFARVERSTECRRDFLWIGESEQKG